MEQIFKIAWRAARKAGEVIGDNFQKLQHEDIRSKGKNDFVTRVDREAEAAIKEIILDEFPGHRILAEEGGLSAHKGEFLWVIDPLDGTTNFIQGIAHFSVSLALMKNSSVIFGLIYDPILLECFHAAAGQGAFMNDAPIMVSKIKLMSSAFGATGFPFKAPHLLTPYADVFKILMPQCQDLRRCGSAALDLAYVACGRYDFFWESHLLPWDFMAGKLIVEEAGGTTSDFSGKELPLQTSSVLAANRHLHPMLLDLIGPYFSQPEFYSSR
ncbi:MAG: inositol monophosphatase family protein [Candidatus Aminicenantes bacterium]|nr:inositol monophosphatase family protein [Candidatus Aminicenantes bacterium]